QCQQYRGGIAAAASQSGAVRNTFLELDVNVNRLPGALAKKPGRAHGEIGVVGRQAAVAASESKGRRVFDGQFIGQVDGGYQCVNLMKSVWAFADNPEREVDLCARHAFHSAEAVTSPASAKDRIIAAIDVPDEASALQLIRQLRGRVGFFKLGLELFTASGPGIVEKARREGEAKIFLDLKFHDIPNTVSGAVRSTSSLGVDLLTSPLAGGGAMLSAAAAAVGPQTMLLGVSVLTSSSSETQRETGADPDIPAQVRRLVGLGIAHGIKGFVASGH